MFVYLFILFFFGLFIYLVIGLFICLVVGLFVCYYVWTYSFILYTYIYIYLDRNGWVQYGADSENTVSQCTPRVDHDILAIDSNDDRKDRALDSRFRVERRPRVLLMVGSHF